MNTAWIIFHPADIDGAKRRDEMAEPSTELTKLTAVATDLEFPIGVRTKALETLGNIGTHEALLVLLDMAGNDKLTRKERELALKHAGRIIKSIR